MKILLDHCVDRRLKRSLSAHQVRTTKQMDWEQFRNGLLLKQAATGFDIFLTTDKNIRHQQNLAQLPLPVIELNGVDGRLKSLQALAPHFEPAIQQTTRYLFVAIFPDGRIECLAERAAAP
jgi:hypothetical protein